MSDEFFKVVWAEVGELSPSLEAVSVGWSAHEVHGHVPDDGHVLGSVACSEAGEVFVEDDVEDPVEAVLDVPMGAHGGGEGLGVGDEGAGEFESLQEARDGGDLVGLGVCGLLAEHEALAGSPGRDRVQRCMALATGMAAAGGLAIDRDDVRRAVAQDLDPSGEAGLEQVGIQRFDHVVEGIVSRQGVRIFAKMPK